MEKAEKDFEDLLKSFNKYRVRYCIVGAYALAFHALPRYTKDIDIFVEASPDNATRIIRALKAFGFGDIDLQKDDFVEEGKTIQLGYEPVRIDLLTAIDGCPFNRAWKHKIKGVYGKQKVFFIGLNDLIKNKTASNRKQDQADLEALKAVQTRRAKRV